MLITGQGLFYRGLEIVIIVLYEKHVEYRHIRHQLRNEIPGLLLFGREHLLYSIRLCGILLGHVPALVLQQPHGFIYLFGTQQLIDKGLAQKPQLLRTYTCDRIIVLIIGHLCLRLIKKYF